MALLLPIFGLMNANLLVSSWKRFGVLLALLAFLSGCESGRPDLNDPVAVADYLCEQSNAVKALGEKGDKEGAMELLMDIKAFEQEVRTHHGDAFGEFNSEMEREMNERCLLDVPE